MNQFRILSLSAGLVLFSVVGGSISALTVTGPSSTTSAPVAPVAEPALATPPVQDLKSAAGKWKSIDDETGKAKSIIEITEDGDAKLVGKIIQLFREPSEDQNPKCDKCVGDKKDQPILNMQIMHGFKKKSDGKWADGEILDPKNGKVYSCKVALAEGGKKLEVRGFIGISLLGRTQVWERL